MKINVFLILVVVGALLTQVDGEAARMKRQVGDLDANVDANVNANVNVAGQNAKGDVHGSGNVNANENR